MIKLINEVSKQFEPFVTPDSLRAILSSLKSFYDLHTKENYGYEDINGSQYYGSVNNYGSEMLIETRKLRMNKPSLKNVFIRNTFQYYFDLKYSELINTYDQQNTIVAILNKDVLMSNVEYRIRFDDCDERCILRAESSSDPDVWGDSFYVTDKPPTLIAGDVEISLIIDDGSHETTYYFYSNSTTESFVDEYDYETNTLTTKPLTDQMNGLPFIWICIDKFRRFPDAGWINNIDFSGRPLLTFGTDGHDKHFLYPMVYDNNIPIPDVMYYIIARNKDQELDVLVDDKLDYEYRIIIGDIPYIDDDDTEGEWFIKIEPSSSESFVTSSNPNTNSHISIQKIYYIYAEDIHTTPEYSSCITFDETVMKVFINPDMEWKFRSPKEGDYDYDGKDYHNPCYGYIQLNKFNGNIVDDNRHLEYPAFRVKFNTECIDCISNDHFHEDAWSGIHIDSLSEYADNGIMKKNGVIHELGDFDGLPKHFKYYLNRNTHRAHVEMYSIRDNTNNTKHKAICRQTSALIFDSGIPITETFKTMELNTVIKYKPDSVRTYSTYGESVSQKNVLSEITYIDDNHFGNQNIDDQSELTKFIYHGNRYFSTKVIDFDSMEKGRVYYVNNDSCEYENNTSTENKKPDRTIARICDIPTSFLQLIHITNYAPTYVVDKNYNRSEVPYTLIDKAKLYNDIHPRLVTPTDGSMVFTDDSNLNEILSQSKLIDLGYGKISNIINEIDMSNPSTQTDYSFNVKDGGVGYSTNDRFTTIIGGVFFEGYVTKVDSSHVVGIMIKSSSNRMINLDNIQSRISTWKTTTLKGTGSGLSLTLEFTPDAWDSFQPKITSVLEGLYALKFDANDNVWAWVYNQQTKEWIEEDQITGPTIYENRMDIRNKYLQKNRRLCDVLTRYMIMHDHVLNDYSTSVDIREINTTIDHYLVIDVQDLSHRMHDLCSQDSYYMIKKSKDGELFHTAIKFTRFPNNETSSLFDTNDILPRYHDLNLEYYNNKSNMLSFKFKDGCQPEGFYYNPTKKTIETTTEVCQDLIRIDSTRNLDITDVVKDFEDFKPFENNKLTGYLYSYNEYCEPRSVQYYRTQLSTKSFDDLRKIIQSQYNEDSYLLKLSDDEYSHKLMMDYIMMNYIMAYGYKKDNIKVCAEISTNKKDITPPTGGYEHTTSDVFNPNLNINSKTYTSDLLYVFRLDTPLFSFDLSSYRILDEMDNDISSQSLLIWNRKMYVFYKDEWRMITRKENNE